MRLLFMIATGFLALPALATAGEPEARALEEGPGVGAAVPAIQWVDSSGRSRSLLELRGHPLVVLPAYTSCQGTCSRNVEALARALAESGADRGDYRVLLFSFDPEDTPRSLGAYAAREKLPTGWLLGTSDRDGVESLTRAIGFRFSPSGDGQFIHPNLVVVLDPDLKVSSSFYGSRYRPGQLRSALSVAARRGTWTRGGWHWAFAFLALVVPALGIWSALLLQELRRSSRSRPSSRSRTP